MTAKERLADNEKFVALAELEPALWALAEDVLAVRAGSKRFCANARWLGFGDWWGSGFRERVSKLVGWLRKGGPSQLRTSEAYDVVYMTLYPLLPNCRNCGCM